MQYAKFRYRHATPIEKFKMDVRYAVRAHQKGFVGAALEIAVGFAWIFAIICLLPIFASCIR